MNGVGDPEPDDPDFVEVDPTGRYGRYNEILGKGASKIVYRAFDEYQGIEVAWNQVKLCDFLHNPEDLERLYCEIHLLKTLKHDNIMKFYASWVDTANRNINFVTEMFTSGTLRQYRLKHKRVNIRAVKHWCRQILKGLVYLHGRDPPVIHRDLKCDNIFVNGNQGEVKIGDLGLAAILRKSHAARCVGTPEFMAPEIYEEEYNELVDIYSFGMCILEMITFEYPYSECTHPAQIYKKVVSGKKPDALYKVKDPEVRRFVEKCLTTVSLRHSAEELLMDPFLEIDNHGSDLRALDYWGDFNEVGPLFGGHCSGNSLINNGYNNIPGFEIENGLNYHPFDYETSDIDLFACNEDEHLTNVDISIKGTKGEDDGVFLRLRIADEEGRIRNIYFPFDIETDTALSVATEMVAELDITDQDVTKIADMIDGEIAALVPGWESGLGIDESSNYSNANFCHNCASNTPLADYVSSNNPNAKNLQVLQCSRHGCTAVHGRFEEITYQVEGSKQCVTGGAPAVSNQSDGTHYTDIWGQRDGHELSTQGLKDIQSDSADDADSLHQSGFEEDERVTDMDNKSESNPRNSFSVNPSSTCTFSDDYENAIRQELRWLKAKYQLQLRELRDQQLGVKSKSITVAQNSNGSEHRKDNTSFSLVSSSPTEDASGLFLNYFASRKHFPSYFPANHEQTCQRVPSCEATTGPCSHEKMAIAKSFSSGALLPQALHRATSLPVDAVDC